MNLTQIVVDHINRERPNYHKYYRQIAFDFYVWQKDVMNNQEITMDTIDGGESVIVYFWYRGIAHDPGKIKLHFADPNLLDKILKLFDDYFVSELK